MRNKIISIMVLFFTNFAFGQSEPISRKVSAKRGISPWIISPDGSVKISKTKTEISYNSWALTQVNKNVTFFISEPERGSKSQDKCFYRDGSGASESCNTRHIVLDFTCPMQNFSIRGTSGTDFNISDQTTNLGVPRKVIKYTIDQFDNTGFFIVNFSTNNTLLSCSFNQVDFYYWDN